MTIDIKWVKEQLTQNRTKKAVGDSVIKLIETWEALEIADENKETVVDIFSKLSLGHVIVKNNKKENWVQAQSGAISIGDTMRTKFNAFDGEKGKTMNNRRCKVVGIRYGNIVLRSIDEKSPVIDGTHFNTSQLEKLIAV
jgi:hypothetical protein